MSKDVDFKINHDGADELLKSDGVMAMLGDEARSFAGIVQPQFQSHVAAPVEVDVETGVGRTRAEASVVVLHPAAVRIERKHGYFKACGFNVKAGS